jgi:hypothetical protein
MISEIIRASERRFSELMYRLDANQKIVNEDLGPLLGWEGIEFRMGRYVRGAARDKDFIKIARQMVDEHPEFFAKLLNSIDTKKLGEEDLEHLSTILIQLGEILSKGSTDFREAYKKHGKRILEELGVVGVSTAILAHMLGSEEIEAKGVYPCEALLHNERKAFLDQLEI